MNKPVMVAVVVSADGRRVVVGLPEDEQRVPSVVRRAFDWLWRFLARD